METYINQKIIAIKKTKPVEDFLTVSNDDWTNAAKDISTYGAFKLYLYLASNNDGFRMALSQKAASRTLGISKATYHRAVDELINKKYLVELENNNYNFYT